MQGEWYLFWNSLQYILYMVFNMMTSSPQANSMVPASKPATPSESLHRLGSKGEEESKPGK